MEIKKSLNADSGGITTYSTEDIIPHLEELSKCLSGYFEELTDEIKVYYSQMIGYCSIHGSSMKKLHESDDYISYGMMRKIFKDNMRNFTDDEKEEITKIIETKAEELTRFRSELEKGSINNKDYRTNDYIHFFERLGYNFKRNLLDDSIENNGEMFDSFDSAKLQNKTIDSLKKKITAERYNNIILDAAARNAYNPILDYFRKAQNEYIGGEPIDVLSGFFKTNDNTLFNIYLKKWLVGAVAKAHTGEQNAMLVLDGRQGIGKSQFTKWLNPLDGFFHEGAIYPDSKDCLINLAKKFIWEVAELGATTRKADREALKDFITKELVNVRAPYAKQSMSKKALSSFIGTINNEAGFLTDPSGNRRFHVITLKSIDWNYTKFNKHEIWGQAYNLYLNSYNYKLTADEAKARDALNCEYTYHTHVDDLLDVNIEITNDKKDFISSADLTKALKALDCKGSDDSIDKKVSAWMQRNSIEKDRRRFNGKSYRGFKGIKDDFPARMIQNYCG